MLVAFTRFADISAPCGIVAAIRPDGFTISTYRMFMTEGEVPGAIPVDGGDLHAGLAGTTLAVTEPQHFSWAALIGLAQGHDHACIVFPLICRHVGARGGGVDTSWQVGQPYNRTRETMAARRGPREHAARTQEHTMLHLYVPWAGASPDDCALHLILQDGFLPLVTGAEIVEQSIESTMRMVMPVLVLPERIEVPSEGYASVALEARRAGKRLKEASVTAHLETTGGYLPRQRVALIDGAAAIKVGALGLEPGESFKVKVGFRYFPGMAEIVCEVV
jgi:hypothetical protein